jgi:DNA-binding winged helix-turn-helix (wHTH) protein
MQHADVLLIEGETTAHPPFLPIFRDHEYVVRSSGTVSGALAGIVVIEPAMVLVNWRSLTPEERVLCNDLNARLAGTPVVYAATVGVDGRPPSRSIMLKPPWTPRKLLNQVRRYVPSKTKQESVLCAGDLSLNLDRRVVTVERQSVAYLTPRQSDLLAALLRRAGQVVTRRQLMLEVWLTDYMDDTRTLDVHVRWLREAIELDPAHPRRLLTARGEGYLLQPHPSPA